MELMLEIISRQKFSLHQSNVQHVFREVGGYIGRDKECEWVLLDKTKQISRRHALVSFEHAAFFIEDLGFFLNLCKICHIQSLCTHICLKPFKLSKSHVFRFHFSFHSWARLSLASRQFTSY